MLYPVSMYTILVHSDLVLVTYICIAIGCSELCNIVQSMEIAVSCVSVYGDCLHALQHLTM